jgi:hypothetical protein
VSRPDLTGLQPVYRVHLGRALRWVVTGAVALIASSTLYRLLNHPDAWDVGLAVGQVVVFGPLLLLQWRQPDAVFVLEDGLVWQQSFRRRTAVPWQDVREVRPGSRWKGCSSAVLANGRKLPLVAMPLPDARRLADALTASR